MATLLKFSKFKNPQVPRRLVGENQVPPSLAPTHTGTSKMLPEFRLAGEFRKIRAGTQAGLRLCRLPVRPEVWSGPTDTGPVANPPTESPRTSPPTSLSGPAVHASDRVINSHMKASSP